MHPVTISYAPAQTVADATAEALRASGGDVLCFLPGLSEIRRAMGEISQVVGSVVQILPLHGSLDVDAQHRAVQVRDTPPSLPSSSRRVIVATNIAETSLTVPGVTAVVDTGLHKVARYDADRGIDSLETERITADAADQRAGRAGRVAPGMVLRLWDARDRLRPHREPDIDRIDLSATLLDIIAWGGDPRTFEWFQRPREDAIDAALALLERLGLLESSRSHRTHRTDPTHQTDPTLRLTAVGEQVRRLPIHPRLARMLVASGGARDIGRACALLSERHLLPPRRAATSSDLLSAIDQWNAVPPHVHVAARHISEFKVQISDSEPSNPQSTNQSEVCSLKSEMSEAAFRRALLAGYPDRVAQRREAGSPQVLLATGVGATIAPESGVVDGEFLVAHDISRQSPVISRQSAVVSRQSAVVSRQSAVVSRQSALVSRRSRHVTTQGHPADPLIRIASRVEREWLQPTHTETVHRFAAESGRVKAVVVECYDALVLAERPAAVDPEVAAQLLTEAWTARGPHGDDERLLRRLQFAGHAVDVAAMVRVASQGATRLADVHLTHAVAPSVLRELNRDAPETLIVPSGRAARLDYHDDGTVSASVKLQELFGLAETPRIGRRRAPVVLALLAPNGRPVQVTRDLRSFWDRTYPEVRRELRGRYPKHPWPEDPWTAPPTARAKPRR
jgi:ATP-dependent helicase HrpB